MESTYDKVVAATPDRAVARQNALVIAGRADVSATTARRYLWQAAERGDVIASREPGYAERYDFYRPESP